VTHLHSKITIEIDTTEGTIGWTISLDGEFLVYGESDDFEGALYDVAHEIGVAEGIEIGKAEFKASLS